MIQINQEGLNTKKLNNPKSDKSSDGKPSSNKEKHISLEEHSDLEIPEIPEAPKKKMKITKDSPGISSNLLEKMKKFDSRITKVVLVNCERCKEIIAVPIPKKTISQSELPVVPISYIHKNAKGRDQHNITLYLDHDFDIRRQRISDVVLSSDL